MKFHCIVVGLVLSLLLPVITQAADKVVVIPLHTKTVRNAGIQKISVPAGAFHPMRSDIVFTNWGRELYCTGGSFCRFSAPIDLPDKAVIKAITIYYEDCHDDNGYAELLQTTHDGIQEDVIFVETHGGSSGSSCMSGAMSNNSPSITTINNNDYGYYLRVILPYTNSQSRVNFYGTTIEYTTP